MAYVNANINQGGFGSFKVSTDGALTLYQRVVFTTTSDGTSGKPTIKAAGATDRAVGVVMIPGAVGAYVTIRFLNAQGEQFGIASGTIGLGVTVYQGAAGVLTAASGGGALVCGVSTTPGYDGGPFTYMVDPNYA